MTNTETLQVRGISKRYGGVQALADVSMTFRAGEVHCLAGTNGSGKSTLIKIVSGVEKADSGEIVLDGKPLANNTPQNAMRAGIQVIYQDLALFPNLTAAENIAMVHRSLSGKTLVSNRDAKALAEKVTQDLGVALPLDTMVEDLAIADRQLVAICRALAQDAKVLFMDEPTTALTWREVDHLFDVVRTLIERKVAVVFVSHKLDEVLAISDTVTVLRNGVLVEEGPAHIFTQDSLSEALVGQKTVTDRKVVEVSESDSAPALEVSQLGTKGQFADISFAVKQGEIVGLTGLRGSGRTEIAETIFGLRSHDEGQVRVLGNPVPSGNPRDAIDAGIGYVPEDRLTQGMFLSQSLTSNVVSAVVPRVSNRLGVLNRAQITKIVDEGLEAMQTKYGKTSDSARTLSGGNQQKVVLAKWVETFPKILILNGPTVGVDIGSKFAIIEILRNYAEKGVGVLIVSDDYQEVVSVCNRVLVIQKGRIKGELIGEQVTEDAVRELVASEVTK